MKGWIRSDGTAIVFAVALMVTLGGLLSVGQAPAKPAEPELLVTSEVEQLRIETQIKDFQIAQLKFADTINQIKQAHGWGTDVVFDAAQNRFYRLKKAEAPKKQ